MVLRTTASISVTLALVLLMAACSDDDGDAGPAGVTSTTASASSTTGPDPTLEPVVACETPSEDLPPVGEVDDAARGPADLDGDGRDDSITIYAFDGAFRMRAELAQATVDAALPIEDRTAEPAVLGGHDVDGDGTEELFFTAGQGAAATVVGVATLSQDRLGGGAREHCELTSVRGPDGSLLRVAVGASAATQQGLECRDDRLVELRGETTDGERYQWSETVMALEGAALSVVQTNGGTYRSPADAEEIRRLGTLTCGDIALSTVQGA